MGNLGYAGDGQPDNKFCLGRKRPFKKDIDYADFVSPEYIKTAGITIKQGRDFYPVAANDSSSVIINETFAKMIGKENPVGMILSRGDSRYIIAGVAKDFVFGDMYAKNDPLAFLVYPEYYQLHVCKD